MNKRSKRKLSFIDLGSGILFAALSFLFTGASCGYNLIYALICLLGGLIYSLLFFLVNTVKPYSFEDKKDQNKLLDYESDQKVSYELKVSALMRFGKGIKSQFCETNLYFQEDALLIVFCHFRRIKEIVIPYSDIISAYHLENRLLCIYAEGYGHISFKTKLSILDINQFLLNKGLYDGLRWIYKTLKDKYDLTLTTTFALNQDFTFDTPVIVGKAKHGVFHLYSDGGMLVFSTEYFDKQGEERYSHGHPLDAWTALREIEEFMLESSVLN